MTFRDIKDMMDKGFSAEFIMGIAGVDAKPAESVQPVASESTAPSADATQDPMEKYMARLDSIASAMSDLMETVQKMNTIKNESVMPTAMTADDVFARMYGKDESHD